MTNKGSWNITVFVEVVPSWTETFLAEFPQNANISSRIHVTSYFTLCLAIKGRVIGATC